MSEELKPTTPEIDGENKIPEIEGTIQDTKEQLAEAYLNFLDQQKGGLLATGAGLGVSLNPFKKDTIDYLISDTSVEDKKDFFSNIGKNIKKKLIEKVTGGTPLEYDKASLNKMKALITQHKNDQAKLQELMAQIKEGVDPTTIDSTVAPTSTETSKTNIESSDKPSREKVLASLNAVLEQDKKHPIDYLRGGRKTIVDGLDCSGLINYAVTHAGFDMGGDSRNLFKRFPTSKLELDADKRITTDVSHIKEGDVIFRNSVKPGFTWKKYGKPPTVEKDGTSYCIHHVAFVRSVNKENGTVDVVQSSGDSGVNERNIDIQKLSKNQDELYVAHIDYDALPKLSAEKISQLENLPGMPVTA